MDRQREPRTEPSLVALSKRRKGWWGVWGLILLGLGCAMVGISQGASGGGLPLPIQVPLPPAVVYGDEFGASLALDGDFLAVGAPATNVNGVEQQGIVYLFTRASNDPTAFVLVKTLTGSDSTKFDWFGASVALQGDTLVVGAVYAQPGGLFNQGAAYVFQRNQGGADAWGEVTKLVRGDAAVGVNFGTSVAVHGDTIAVGSPTINGRAFLYARNQGGANHWGQTQVLSDNISDINDRFGEAIAFDGQTLVIGASNGDLVSVDVPTGAQPHLSNNAGVVFVFEPENGAWVRKARLFHSDIVLDDLLSYQIGFGNVLALDGDTIFVGVGRGKVNGVMTGKVFVFQLGAGTKPMFGEPGEWGQLAPLSASDGAEGDDFGRSLLATGHGLFVTAPSASSNGTVYFFHNPTVQALGNKQAGSPLGAAALAWSEVYSMTLAGKVTGSRFGQPMVDSGNTVLIGAGGYNSGRGGIFAYPKDALLAADPRATPSPTPDGIPPAKLAFLPIVANGGSQPTSETTGTLANGGLMNGPGGVKLGAVADTLTATVEIAIATVGAPSETLPSDLAVRGSFFRISGARSLLTDMASSFIVGVAVPAGADTAHLALAYLVPANQVPDLYGTGRVWGFLPGVYDQAHGLFLTKLPFLLKAGTTFALVEHADFDSPLNGAALLAAGSKVGVFTVTCQFFKRGDCTATMETDAARQLDAVYRRMKEIGYTAEPRLLDASLTFVVTDTFSVQAQGFGAVIRPDTHASCNGDQESVIGKAAYYDVYTAELIMCLAPKTTIGDEENSTLAHEYFHSLQYSSLLARLQVINAFVVQHSDFDGGWIIEGTAQAAEGSIDLDNTMGRASNDLVKVDLPITGLTTLVGGVSPDWYKAQDFWVYLGQRFQQGLPYLQPMFDNGGVTTAGVAGALQDELGAPFADLYAGWAENQIFEKVYPLGFGPLASALGKPCELNTFALANGVPESFVWSAQTQSYPTTGGFETVPSLTSALVEVILPHTKKSALIQIAYAECAGITDPAAQDRCAADVQKVLHAKIYMQDEPKCAKPQTEGGRFVQTGGIARVFVVVANGDITKEHGFAINVE